MSIRQALATYLDSRRNAALAAFDLACQIGAEIVAPLRIALPYTLAVASTSYARALEQRGKHRAAAEMSALATIMTGYISGQHGDSSMFHTNPKPPMLIPVMATLEPGQTDVEVLARPSKRCLVYGAKAFMEPGVETTAIRPSLRIEDPCPVSGKALICVDEDRLCPGGELDLSYFTVDEEFALFDFGAADPDHPIRFCVNNKTNTRRQVCIVLFSSPFEESSEADELIRVHFGPVPIRFGPSPIQ